jgi:FkbH-like protein
MGKIRIVVTANFTAEPVAVPLSFLLRQITTDFDLEFAPYNQVFQQLLDPSSLCRQNRDGINVVLVRLEDWGRVEARGNGVIFPPDACQSIERAVHDFEQALGSATKTGGGQFLVVVCPASTSARMQPKVSRFLSEMEQVIASGLENARGIDLILPDFLAAGYPVKDYDDPQGSSLGHIPYSQLFYAALGGMIARRAYRLKTHPHKVIALDCDQTIWAGVCGEDGPLGIEIDSPRRGLQEFMVNQHKSGMLLCLCSRNNEQDVFQAFECNPQMPLRRDHILAWRINWQDKSANLRSLASELQLGLDSFIFVDDDPAVCSEVRARCPEVLTLQLPRDPQEIIPFLRHVWAFDRFGSTLEDETRTTLYRVNLEREQLRSKSATLEDFLVGLRLEVTISPLLPADVPRVSQLTQRTNQFNLTTIRRSEPQISQLCQMGEAECLTVRVRDRFGDYGLVGVMIFLKQRGTLDVDTFLLSCRALGRGVEHRMLAHLGEVATEYGLAYVDIRYRQTDKNRPAHEFISRASPDETRVIAGGSVFRIPADVASGIRLDPSAPSASEPTDNRAAEIPMTGPSQPDEWFATQSFVARAAVEYRSAEHILKAVEAENANVRKKAAGLPSAPRDETEATLQAIWARILGSGIGVEDNYFEHGGDSFRAVWILSEVERVLGKHLPLASFLEAPTIRQLAHLLRGAVIQKPWSSLVPIQPEGSRPPFYCIHAAGGDVLFYRDLAKHLGKDQPLYGLQARGVNRNQTTHDSVEEMAASYLAEIRLFQPEGPYFLGGSSFGGLVAFEMARQLEAEGVGVGLVALFDTYGPGYPILRNGSRFTRIARAWLERVRNLRASLNLLEPRERAGYLLAKARKGKRFVLRKILWKKNQFSIAFRSATGRPLPRDVQRNHKAIDHAMRSYHPQCYGGRLTIFRAEMQPIGALPDPTLGWRGRAKGGVDVNEVPGSHGAVTVDPHARFLAEKLNASLLKAQVLHERSSADGRLGRTKASAQGVVVPSIEAGPVQNFSGSAS